MQYSLISLCLAKHPLYDGILFYDIEVEVSINSMVGLVLLLLGRGACAFYSDGAPSINTMCNNSSGSKAVINNMELGNISINTTRTTTR